MGFAAFAGHCSLFVMDGTVLESFREELKEFPTSKGTVRFCVDKPLPAAVVKKIVKARIEQNEHECRQRR